LKESTHVRIIPRCHLPVAVQVGAVSRDFHLGRPVGVSVRFETAESHGKAHMGHAIFIIFNKFYVARDLDVTATVSVTDYELD